MRHAARSCIAIACLALGACRDDAPRALGTLEWDRITLPAPATERIVSVDVREGQRVAAGTRLLQVEDTRTRAQFDAAQAQAAQSERALDELVAGPRAQAIAQARAALAAAQAQAREARAFLARVQPLGRRQLVSRADVDRATAAAASADAQVASSRAALDELEAGTRRERIAQGEAALAAMRAQARVQADSLRRLDVVAPRAGWIDALPFEAGDQPPAGATVAVMLVGERPFARVYVPQPLRARVRVGTPARVRVAGRGEFDARVRMVRNEPVFTPYYALAGDDAARLSYVAELDLAGDASRELPPGMPVEAEFPGVRNTDPRGR